jgi:hypothetical protein
MASESHLTHGWPREGGKRYLYARESPTITTDHRKDGAALRVSNLRVMRTRLLRA